MWLKLNTKAYFYWICINSTISLFSPVIQVLTVSDIFEDSEKQSMFKRLYVAAPSTKPYNLSEPENINPSMGQAQEIDKILKQKVGLIE